MEHTDFYQTSASGIDENELVFHKVVAVEPLHSFRLKVQFEDGTNKEYDVATLFDRWNDFCVLRNNPALFQLVKVEPGGYAVSWNDAIDIACNELWNNGV